MYITTNEDRELVKELRRKIYVNLGHCPNATKFNADNMCMCTTAKAMIANEKEGYCPCGLYKFEKESR